MPRGEADYYPEEVTFPTLFSHAQSAPTDPSRSS
jgi:hypothetical protein